jgi:hypothetical protein
MIRKGIDEQIAKSKFHDDTVYYIRDDDVWAVFWHAPVL